ncbi:hypothetical protein GCM10009727_91570 [Actinomadura napierensis]|uniref:Uncharacterized protein n=1 Tax=Actinomadura napierensis TaxID=267854 RepID=A0ABP5MBQ5_9ACTN
MEPFTEGAPASAPDEADRGQPEARKMRTGWLPRATANAAATAATAMVLIPLSVPRPTLAAPARPGPPINAPPTGRRGTARSARPAGRPPARRPGRPRRAAVLQSRPPQRGSGTANRNVW